MNIAIDPIITMDIIQENLYYLFSIFDFHCKAIVLDKSHNLKNITNDNNFKKEITKIIKLALKNQILTESEATRIRILFSLIHSFLHGDFSSFLRKTKLLKNKTGIMIETNNLLIIPLSEAKENELYAWKLLLTNNAHYIDHFIKQSIRDLDKIYKIRQIVSSANGIKVYNNNIYYRACMKITKFEIQLRILATNLSIETFNKNSSVLIEEIIKKHSKENISILEICLYLRNRIRHPQLTNNSTTLIGISPIISVVECYIKNNYKLDNQKIIKDAEMLELSNKHITSINDPLYDWISGNGWCRIDQYFDCGLSFIDYLLHKIGLND